MKDKNGSFISCSTMLKNTEFLPLYQWDMCEIVFIWGSKGLI
jgi:hypothetical protein